MMDEKTENDNKKERNSKVVVVTRNMTYLGPSLSRGVLMVNVLCLCQILRMNNECFLSYLQIDIDYPLLPCYHIFYLLLQ